MTNVELEKFVSAAEQCFRLIGGGISWQDAGTQAAQDLPEDQRNDLLRLARAARFAANQIALHECTKTLTFTMEATRDALGFG